MLDPIQNYGLQSYLEECSHVLHNYELYTSGHGQNPAVKCLLVFCVLNFKLPMTAFADFS